MKKLLPLLPTLLALAAIGIAVWWPSLLPTAWLAGIGWMVLTLSTVGVIALFVLSLLANGMRS